MISRETKVLADHCVCVCSSIVYENFQITPMSCFFIKRYGCCVFCFQPKSVESYGRRKREKEIARDRTRIFHNRTENVAKIHIVSIQLAIELVVVMFMKKTRSLTLNHCYESNNSPALNGGYILFRCYNYR